jgi:hypothetical protein
MMEKKDQQESMKIAGRQYNTEDYRGADQVSSGLAETHEQISDKYMESPFDATIAQREENQSQ